MADKKIVINRGPRTFYLKPGTDGTPRTLGPTQSIECLDEAEFKGLISYKDIADADIIVPANEKRVKALQAQIDALKAANAKLMKDQEVTAPPPETTPEPEEPSPEKPAEDAPRKKKGK